MRIGLDLDNTIVCYDKSIAKLADEIFDLPPNLDRTKLALRDFLRRSNREPEWTSFQGALYGPGMAHAEPFNGVLETLQVLNRLGHTLRIISHRSRQPYTGPAHDLHAYARRWVNKWLASNNLIENAMVHLHETRAQKITAIEVLGCEVFVDDLPEVLEDKKFPNDCQKILFDPEDLHTESGKPRITNWAELPELIAKLR